MFIVIAKVIDYHKELEGSHQDVKTVQAAAGMAR